jgi:hypothetical protein
MPRKNKINNLLFPTLDMYFHPQVPTGSGSNQSTNRNVYYLQVQVPAYALLI